MNRTIITVSGLLILIAGYALHLRSAFALYHLCKALAICGGHR